MMNQTFYIFNPNTAEEITKLGRELLNKLQNMTIQESAFEYGKEFIGLHNGYEAFAEQEDVTEAYIAGAKYQLDKVCDWLTQRLSFGVHPCNGLTVVEELRKAME